MDSSEEQLKSIKCMICNKELTYIACPYCGKLAHKIGFLEWLKVKNICPICRLPIKIRYIDNDVILEKIKNLGLTKREIEGNQGIPQTESQIIVKRKNEIIDIIKKFDESSGVDYKTILSKTDLNKEDLDDIILILKIEGTIIETSPSTYQHIVMSLSTTPFSQRCVECDFRLSPKEIDAGETICRSCKRAIENRLNE